MGQGSSATQAAKSYLRHVGEHLEYPVLSEEFNEPPPLEQRELFDIVDACLCSTLVYQAQPDDLLRQLQRGIHHGLKFVKLAKRKAGTRQQQYAVAASADRKTFFIGFRGTIDMSDVLTDINVLQMSRIGGSVHAGFLRRAKEFPLRLILDLLATGKRVVITGHSLGAAVATLVTVHLLEVLGLDKRDVLRREQLKCITFASPLVVDEDFARGLKQQQDLKGVFHHLVQEGDLVPVMVQLYHVTVTHGHTAAEFRQWWGQVSEQTIETGAELAALAVAGGVAAAGPAVQAAAGALTKKLVSSTLGVLKTVAEKSATQALGKPFYPFGNMYRIRRDGIVERVKDKADAAALLAPPTEQDLDAQWLMRHKLSGYMQAVSNRGWSTRMLEQRGRVDPLATDEEVACFMQPRVDETSGVRLQISMQKLCVTVSGRSLGMVEEVEVAYGTHILSSPPSWVVEQHQGGGKQDLSAELDLPSQWPEVVKVRVLGRLGDTSKWHEVRRGDVEKHPSMDEESMDAAQARVARLLTDQQVATAPALAMRRCLVLADAYKASRTVQAPPNETLNDHQQQVEMVWTRLRRDERTCRFEVVGGRMCNERPVFRCEEEQAEGCPEAYYLFHSADGGGMWLVGTVVGDQLGACVLRVSGEGGLPVQVTGVWEERDPTEAGSAWSRAGSVYVRTGLCEVQDMVHWDTAQRDVMAETMECLDQMASLARLDKLLGWPPAALEVLLKACASLTDESEREDEDARLCVELHRALDHAAWSGNGSEVLPTMQHRWLRGMVGRSGAAWARVGGGMRGEPPPQVDPQSPWGIGRRSLAGFQQYGHAYCFTDLFPPRSPYRPSNVLRALLRGELDLNSALRRGDVAMAAVAAQIGGAEAFGVRREAAGGIEGAVQTAAAATAIAGSMAAAMYVGLVVAAPGLLVPFAAVPAGVVAAGQMITAGFLPEEALEAAGEGKFAAVACDDRVVETTADRASIVGWAGSLILNPNTYRVFFSLVRGTAPGSARKLTTWSLVLSLLVEVCGAHDATNADMYGKQARVHAMLRHLRSPAAPKAYLSMTGLREQAERGGGADTAADEARAVADGLAKLCYPNKVRFGVADHTPVHRVAWDLMRTAALNHCVYQKLAEHFYVGVVGQAKQGKSMLLAGLSSDNTNFGNRTTNRTRELRSYTSVRAKGVCFLDFPGKDDLASTLPVFGRGVQTLDVVIVVVPGNFADDRGAVEVLEKLSQLEAQCQPVVLVCLHRADEWLTSLSECTATALKEAVSAKEAQVRSILHLRGVRLASAANNGSGDGLQVAFRPTCFDLRNIPSSGGSKQSELQLSQYLSKLQEEGYDLVSDVAQLELDELIDDIGMKKGHAKRLRAHFA